MTASPPSRELRSWRTHCNACGERKVKVWGAGRATLSKHCPNDKCHMHGIPQLFAVKTVITFDRLGRRHTAHKEFTVRRRPQFSTDGLAPGPH